MLASLTISMRAQTSHTSQAANTRSIEFGWSFRGFNQHCSAPNLVCAQKSVSITYPSFIWG